MRVTRRAVVIGLLPVILTGCGRQVAKMLNDSSDLLAVTPDTGSLPVRPDFVSAAIDAAGGLPAWTQCGALDLRGVVTAYQPDNSYYLTEHAIAVFPWSQAIVVSAEEPQSTFVWRVVGDRFEQTNGDANADVSPLSGAYRSYLTAVLRIVTAPTRLLDREIRLTRQPLPMQIKGQQYDLIDAQFFPGQAAADDERAARKAAEHYWTNGTYFQNQQNSRVEMVWLANEARQDFLVVRGYDYAAQDGVLIPSKIELFRSDAEARIGQRFAKIDLAM